MDGRGEAVQARLRREAELREEKARVALLEHKTTEHEARCAWRPRTRASAVRGDGASARR